MTNILRELNSGILQMNRGDIQSASNKFLEIGTTSGRKLHRIITSETDYDIIKETTYTMQSATLYYYTRALEKQKKGDVISSLAYSAYAAGINAILVTTFLPILRKCASLYHNQAETENIEKINSYVEQEINSMTLRGIEIISGRDRQQTLQKVGKTTQKMMSLTVSVVPEIRDLAVNLSKRFAAGDFKQARRLYEYVRDEITYIHDPIGVEEIQPPEITLRRGGGDCDDKAVLLAALLKSIGFETCFLIADTDNDKYPDHVFTGVYLPEAPEYYKPFPKKRLADGKDFHEWIPLDPTYEDSDFGMIPITDIGILEYLPIVANEKNE